MKSVLLRLSFALAACAVAMLASPADPAARAASGETDALVERLARVGRSYAATFSPDGRHLALISDLSGVPQVWIVAAAGGWPRAVTVGSDPVGGVAWSPNSDWLALTILPGGGLNAQVYVVRPDGSGLRRLTDGGKENNGLGGWTDDGRFLTVDSNRRKPDTMDAYLLDPVSGRMDMVADLNGVGGIEGVSRDGKRALIGRLRSRGDNNLYLLDLETRKEVLLTPHDPPGLFDGRHLARRRNRLPDLQQGSRPGRLRAHPHRREWHAGADRGDRRAARRRDRRVHPRPRGQGSRPRLERRRPQRGRVHRPRLWRAGFRDRRCRPSS